MPGPYLCLVLSSASLSSSMWMWMSPIFRYRGQSPAGWSVW